MVTMRCGSVWSSLPSGWVRELFIALHPYLIIHTGSVFGSVLGGRWSDRVLAYLKSRNGGISQPEVHSNTSPYRERGALSLSHRCVWKVPSYGWYSSLFLPQPSVGSPRSMFMWLLFAFSSSFPGSSQCKYYLSRGPTEFLVSFFAPHFTELSMRALSRILWMPT